MPQWTRKAILDSFERQIAARPLDRIKVKDIVEDCGITRNTFYYHFDDICALATAVLRERLETMGAQISSPNDWEDFLLLLAQQASANLRTVRHLFRSSKSQPLNRFMDELLRLTMDRFFDYLAAGRAVTAEAKRRITDFYRFALAGMAQRWLNSTSRDEAEQLVRDVLPLLRSGMMAAIEEEI